MIKAFLKWLSKCDHSYKYLGTIKTTWVDSENKESAIFTDLLECEHCQKRKVIYQYKYLTGDKFRKYMDLWIKHEFEVEPEWFEG